VADLHATPLDSHAPRQYENRAKTTGPSPA